MHEALTFSGQLRFNGNASKTAMGAFVDEILDLVELHGIRNSLVRPAARFLPAPAAPRCTCGGTLQVTRT